VRRLPLVLTIVLGVVTGLLAAQTISSYQDARTRAREGLEAVHAAAGAAFAGALGDMEAALIGWQPGTEAPAPFDAAERFRAFGDPAGVRAVEGRDLALRFGGRRLEVVVPDPGGEGSLRGVVSAETLRRLMTEAAGVGAPADVARRVPGRYSRLQIVAGESGAVLWTVAAPPTSEEDGPLDMAQLIAGSGSGTRAQRELVAGNAGGPLPYKDGGGGKTVGLWSPIEGVPGLWLVSEIRDDASVLELRGWEVGGFGIELNVYPWHVGLGLFILALLITLFLGLRSRGMQLGVLLRVFTFVRKYAWGAATVVLLGFLFTGANVIVRVFFLKALVDDALVSSGPEAEEALWTIGTGMAVMAVVIAAIGYLKSYLHNLYAALIMADIRYAIGKKIVSLPLSYFQRMRAGDLVSRIERDAAHMKRVFGHAFGTVAIEPFELMFLVTAAFVSNWRLALVLLGMPLVVYPLFAIARRIKKRAEKRQILAADVSHVLFQMLTGIKVVKAFGGADVEAARLRNAIDRQIRQSRRVIRLNALSGGLLDMLQMLGAAVVMVAGGYFVLDGTVTVGDVTAFIVIIQRIYKASKGLTNTANKLVSAGPGVVRVFEVLDAENELEDGPQTLEKAPLTQGIRFEDVSFAYGEKRVIEDVSLDIPAGQVVAIVGPTGAGKSTLCDLVARFYDPSEGRITYDGVDVREYTVASLLDSIAVVTQDAFLFNASIEENILYGDPGATREQMKTAAQDAFVADEIESMEGGYEKLAGERGSSVSGGQRQRITIARALLKNAPVLILDEATSALDSHAEKQVQAALDKLMQGRTVIVVAHRLSTIRNADKVVVLKDGRIVEQGPPADLLARDDGVFRRMYELQMGSGRAVM
jgi:subfamily B ATP-binding cassette protein MsbA